MISAPEGAPRFVEASIAAVNEARYDGHAQWYEHEFMGRPGSGTDTREVVTRLLGHGSGRLLDVGCGTGVYAESFTQLGWSVTGVDVSEDMLQFARERKVDVVCADARSLPFDAGSFDAAVSLWTHTDVGDFAAVTREIARVLLARRSLRVRRRTPVLRRAARAVPACARGSRATPRL